MSLHGGPLGFAIGAEFRRHRVKYFIDRALASQASSSGYADASDQAGQRSIWTLFSEVNVRSSRTWSSTWRRATTTKATSAAASIQGVAALAAEPLAPGARLLQQGFSAPRPCSTCTVRKLAPTPRTPMTPPCSARGDVPAPGANPNIACGQQQFIREGSNCDVSPKRART
ncbi:hypothetical protein MASSI9I_20573 [Massilia sp. 9I]|nr:hypothetical protein MASSI9I_20573 [Massilia sp. 9I]